jgi:hypothetical protein
MIKRKDLLYRIVITCLYAFIASIVGVVIYFSTGLISQAHVTSDIPADSTSHLQQLGIGIQAYAKDHNGNLPNMMLALTFKQQVYPYVKSDSAFVSEVSSKALQPNWRLDGSKITALNASTVVMFDPSDNVEGTYSVLYGSWDTAVVPKAQLDQGLGNS